MPSLFTLEGPRLGAEVLPAPLPSKKLPWFLLGLVMASAAATVIVLGRRVRRLGDPRRIASESKTAEEYARRAEAWNASEAKPQSLTKLARAWAGGREGPKVMRLLRESRETREENRQRLWSKAARGLRGLRGNSIAEVRDELKKLGVQESIFEHGDEIHVSKIVVPKSARGSGVGTKAMKSLVEYADKTGKRIVLTPSTDFGGSSVARLKSFYKRFGFVENKGRHKDFSIRETMFRTPR